MGALITEEMMQNALSWAWDSSINGVPGSGTAVELANDYLKENENLESAIDSLVSWQVRKCGASGFITGLGGLATMPVAIPVNLGSTLYIQMRMVAAIAYMCGKDIHSDQVQTLGYLCLCGNSGKEVVRNFGIQIGTKIARQQIQRIPRETLKAINRAVGFKLITKFGEKGIINLGKMVPVVGGVISCGVDAAATRAIAAEAKNRFYYSDGEDI
ncbi:EcsC family protein [Megasphaera sp. DISK 18]|uniref:EcsC family protein n=1 Tax=Megasphaera sp. DISK 18 TaxID=1776081 RepID=UPI0008071307|nr:EcsC family protein [Megasphaera sp. DISK 18]OBZ32693.1 EcsC family protein [Megasphaera sp. DISK 18]